MFKRSLRLPANPKRSFFLWGMRQTGKSTLLKGAYPNAFWVDLLTSSNFRKYTNSPELLRQELSRSENKNVVIDEVQKVPALLDEVHWLIENKGIKFILCGSSARKLRRGHANLLGGRALRYELHGLVSDELQEHFDLNRIINHGYLPSHYLEDAPKRLIESYISDYLREEIAAEGLVRNLPGFSNFLDVAALSDCEMVNMSTIARDCGVSSHTIKEYFQILADTMLGYWLPSFKKRPKRRVIGTPKFYFSDVGVVNHLAKRGRLVQGSELFGKAFENWIYHELRTHSHYSEMDYELSYWRTAGGVEVDFIIGDMNIIIEAKASEKIGPDHLRGLRSIIDDYPKINKRIVVCLEAKERITDDGIIILPYDSFCKRLWAGLKF